MKKIYYLAALVLSAYQLNAQTYCTPAFGDGCSGGDVIDSFTIPSVSYSQLSTGCSNTSYEDFYATETITLQAGIPFAYEITHGYPYQNVKIWADFNNDGSFTDDATETISTAVSVGNITNGTLLVPGSVAPGTYRMRVADKFNSFPLPCNANGYGEAQDYKLVVTAAPSCLTPTAITASGATATTFNLAWTASLSNPANGYDVYYSNASTPPDANTTPQLTGLTGVSTLVNNLQPSTEYFVWMRSSCSTSDKSIWNSAGKITTLTFCPSVSSPANGANGQSLTPTITWAAVANATGYTLTVGTTPGSSDVLSGVDLGNVTSYTFTTPLALSTNYYYTVNAYNASVTSNSCEERSFQTLCSAYTIPYNEGFENGYTDNTAVAGCWAQEGVSGNQEWTANNTATDYNRTPRTGAWNAFLRFYNDRWMFIPVQLTAGVSYKTSVYARQDGGSSTEANITLAYGTAASAAAMTNIIAPSTGIVDGNYQKVSGNFTPTTSGVYFVGLKGGVSYDPYYLSIDDFSIELASACVEPSGVAIASYTTTSANATWTAAITAPANGYDVFYTNSTTPPTSTTTPSLNTSATTASITTLSPNTTYYVWVRSNCGTETSTWEGPATVYTGYCQPNVTPNVFFMGAVTTTGGTTNLNYTNGSFISYDNQSASAVTASAGSTINMVLDSNDNTETYSYNAWIDWNNDLIFDDVTEKIYTTDPSVAYETTATVNFTIPTGQAAGNYRMRTGVSWAGEMNPCGPEGEGNYVDFTVTVTGNQATNETKVMNGISVYPNPFTDVLSISEVKDVQTVVVADASGRKLKYFTQPSAELKLNDLKSGLYFVTLTMKSGEIKTFKVIKK